MSLLENNQFKTDQLSIEWFEKMLRKLLASHADYKKQIIALTAENKALKELLERSKSNLTSSTGAKEHLVSFDKDLVNQINKYIKEIDLCLAYFEEA